MAKYTITSTYPLNKANKIPYRLEHNPTEDEPWNWGERSEEVEVYDPSPIPSNHVDSIPEGTFFKPKYLKQSYHLTSTIPNKKIKYNMAHNIDDIDERGVIEIPADNDTVIYQDEDGQYYEIDVDELIDYDGDDGEITYHGKALHKVGKKRKYKRFPKLNLLPGFLQYQQQLNQRVHA